ncbi:hypothetical protein FSP39_024059 [Pinctada imbricata]|uniref:MPN domain-containing protein n=1 Tax=Pinctada imbricata TaxID=66713 RepID=A0AA89BIE1_PINIB|nr:hypothetical protein FSP39_024059 [Pinctada imbricata]
MEQEQNELIWNQEEDDDEEDDDDEDCDEEDERSNSLAKAAITGRCVTLYMLITEKVIEPGPALLSLKYLGRRFIADLLPDGRIQMPGTKETFTSPSAWAVHCKRQVNPDKKSGCGWASVLYKGKKLDVWKAAWFRKHRPSSPAVARSTDEPDKSNQREEESSEYNNNCNHRVIIKHSALQKRSQNLDNNTLVECESFKTLGKAQPFTVSMTTNSMLLMDYHSHLTSSEVVGYLGGKWDQSAQHLMVTQAYPCRCRLADSQRAALVEEEIKLSMQNSGFSLVGWYHSHPFSAAHPSIKDIDCQMSYQLHMKGSGSTYYPCVGIIIAPYNRKRLKLESVMRMYMVMPPLESEPSDYGIPMSVKYSTRQNPSLTEEVLGEMKELVDFYKDTPDWLKFRQSWQPSITFLEKIKGSLANKLPEDQMEKATFLDYVQHLILPK